MLALPSPLLILVAIALFPVVLVGSIALDLAPAIAPGRIVGVDADEGQLEAARKSAAERGIDNATFVPASVYELPFEDSTFDVVYANAVLMYVREQVRALAEMRRVLRDGGEIVILNLTYRSDIEADRGDLLDIGGRQGLTLTDVRLLPLQRWDGTLFRLRRA